jgi:hypothetical protein
LKFVTRELLDGFYKVEPMTEEYPESDSDLEENEWSGSDANEELGD